MSTLQIHAIPAFTDNYIWIIHNGRYACVVDPGEKSPVSDYLHKNKLELRYILVTHHHADHTGGVLDLVHECGASVFGPMGKIEGIDTYVGENDVVNMPELNWSLNVLEVPGHTLDHIAYVGEVKTGEYALFCGDTLFSCGSGRLFEGDSKSMLQSLDKFKKIGENILVYCAHEYTLSNIKWALTVEPDNPTLRSWQQQAVQLREKGIPTIPTLLKQELKMNPFLRVDQEDVWHAAERHVGHRLTTPFDVFTVLREWKNTF